jgi:hypothetical protein
MHKQHSLIINILARYKIINSVGDTRTTEKSIN